MRYTVGPFQVDTDTTNPLGLRKVCNAQEFQEELLAFLEAVGRRLEHEAGYRTDLEAALADLRQPRPIEQALAVLAQAWQSAVKPAETERLAMPDVLLEAQRAGWDSHAVSGSVLPDADNPWPAETPLWRSWREGWLMAQNDEARP